MIISDYSDDDDDDDDDDDECQQFSFFSLKVSLELNL